MARLALLVLAALPGLVGAQTYEASSSQRDELAPARAFDGDAKTRWSARFDERTGWIQVRFDEAVTYDRVELVSGIADLKGAPKSFRVLAGEPDALKELAKVAGNAADPANARFPRTKARCWRIAIEELVNDRWSPTLTEVRFSLGEATPEPTPTGAPKVTTSPAAAAARGGEAALDGDPATWFEAKSGKTAWIELTWEEPQAFDALELDLRARGGFGVPRDFRLRAKVGSRWTTVLEAENVHRNRPRLRFEERRAKSWRLEITAVVDEKAAPRVGELRLLSLGKEDFAPLPAAALDERAVNAAIDRGAKWLEGRRGEDGTWKTSHTEEFPMGVMSLVGMALKKSGRDREDPLLVDLVARLEKMPLQKTYSVALYAMFLRAISPKRNTERVKACADWLAKAQAPDGLWGYPDGRADLSNAQYALLGLKAARECGCDVPDKVFERSLDWLIDGAQKDGGFNYVPTGKSARDPATGSMTAAALACIDICLKALPKDRARHAKAAPIVEAAFKWLDERFVVEMNPQSPMSHFYWLYGVERVGDFWDRREIGGRRWYPEGAVYLLDWQRRDGSWPGDVVDTCFALLFLNRASLTD
ncbi:MAG: discoidin domain-containing protein [Planctomycetota bacterium]